MLLPIGGTPLIVHTARRAAAAPSVSRVIIATDDERIIRAVEAEGFEARMTSAGHNSGSERIAEVADSLPVGTVVVNVQGDEPLISPETIDRAVEALGRSNPEDEAQGFGSSAQQDIGRVDICTVYEQITNVADVISPDVVKVVTDLHGFALYFSRSPIPFPRNESKQHGALQTFLEREPGAIGSFKKHVGLYVYSREYLLKLAHLPQTELEKIEMLEQLRALENGARIKAIEAIGASIGVDTEEDLQRVTAMLKGGDPMSSVTSI